MTDSGYKVKLFVAGQEIMPYDDDLNIAIRREKVEDLEKQQIQKLINEKTRAAEDYIDSVKAEIAELADKAGVQAYWGEYGNGETYFPVGTDVQAEYLGWEGSEYADENGILTEGVWISSSSMC